MTKITDKQIREFLGHNGHECTVRIRKDGTVERYGSPNPLDRSKDFWAYMGTREDVIREIKRETENLER